MSSTWDSKHSEVSGHRAEMACKSICDRRSYSCPKSRITSSESCTSYILGDRFMHGDDDVVPMALMTTLFSEPRA